MISSRQWFALALLTAAVVTSLSGCVVTRSAGCWPTVVFWAWDRAEDLRFLDTHCTAVAWFAGHVDVDAVELRYRPRLASLQLPGDEPNWPVLRVDAHGDVPEGALEAERRADFVRQLGRFLSRDQLARGLQIDFDAPRSWRPFYTHLLADVRSSLPADAPVTITALASWCLGDPWFRDTPEVTEAVPMLFRMGPDAVDVRRLVESGGSFQAPQCRASVGVSIDEAVPQPPVRAAARVYVFAPRAWTPALVDRAYGLMGVTRTVRASEE